MRGKRNVEKCEKSLIVRRAIESWDWEFEYQKSFLIMQLERLKQ